MKVYDAIERNLQRHRVREVEICCFVLSSITNTTIMAAPRTLRPILRTIEPISRPQCSILRQTNHPRIQRRPFSFSNPLAPEAQTITATRTLRYPSRAIYEVIADVSSYSAFIPYCRSSVVTKTSAPTKQDGKSYPEEAKLVIGLNDGVSEEFWSRVYCVPYHAVEAVSGSTNTTLLADDITHHSPRPAEDEDPTRSGNVLSELLTRWTLRPYHYKPPPTSAMSKETTHKNHEETSAIHGQEKTEVTLTVQVRFANPVYAALSQAAVPRVAEKMIEAFERRVKAVVEGPANV